MLLPVVAAEPVDVLVYVDWAVAAAVAVVSPTGDGATCNTQLRKTLCTSKQANLQSVVVSVLCVCVCCVCCASSSFIYLSLFLSLRFPLAILLFCPCLWLRFVHFVCYKKFVLFSLAID